MIAKGDYNVRTVLNLNQNWLFVKDTADVTVRDGEQITLEITADAGDITEY